MKARTAREKEVVALSASLPPLSPKQEEEARKAGAILFAGKSAGWCTACGAEIPTGELWNNNRKKYITCPHCGARLEIKKQPRKQRYDEVYYYTLTQVCNNWQVIRNFYVNRDSHRAVKIADVEAIPAEVHCNIVEVAQVWMNGDGAPVYMGRSCNCSSWYYDIWRFDTPITVKGYHKRYEISGYRASGAQLLPEVKKHGLKKLIPGVSEVDQIWSVLKIPMLETLAKAGQNKLFQLCIYNRSGFGDYWPSIKVAMRHHFDFQSLRHPSDYLDHLALLKERGKDILNPTVICPEDFDAAHRELVEWKNRKIAKMEAARARAEEERRVKEQEEQRALAEKLSDPNSDVNQEYRKRFAKVLPVVVRKNDIELQPLQDVMDFFNEGTELHHCVFAMKYYQKKNCLILGAKVKGKRTETIEVNTATWTVVQQRGKHNQDSKWHSEIAELVKVALPKLRKCI